MSNIWLLFMFIICWQPIYLGAMFGYHLAKGDIIDRAAYSTAFTGWFSKLWSLVLSKPGV